MSMSSEMKHSPVEQFEEEVEGNVYTYREKAQNTVNSVYTKLTTRHGWFGDYDYVYLFTPDIWPLNKKFRDYEQPYFGINDDVPILLTLLLGVQHCLTLICSLVAVPLLMGDALYLDLAQTQHLVSCTLITAGIATFAQITRFSIYKTPYFVGTGLLSVVGPTFDIIGIAYSYSDSQYANGSCKIAEDGTYLPCPEALGAFLGSMLCTVWIQVLIAFVPPRILKRVFPNMVTGTLLLLLAVYLTGSGMKNWGGGSSCYSYGTNCDVGSHPELWGARAYIGLGFSTFVAIVIISQFGSPIMKSASVVLGLLVGCIISAACNYWDGSGINSAPAGDFLWTKNYTYSVDGSLILSLLIMFVVEGISCIPDIVSTAEASHQPIEGEEFQSRIQGGIMCDALGSVLASVGGGLPMVSQAANNGVILLTGCASRRAGWTAAVLLVLMGIFSKIAATFAALPKPVFGGMQVFLFGTIGVAGIKVLAAVPWTRRNRFILSSGLGWGFAGTVIPSWFDSVIAYTGSNQALASFLEGIELIVETPFIFGALIVCFLNLVIPGHGEASQKAEEPEDSVV
ncbi:unnamed protein product [Kuraishia capsulata CBS 1993]|uniref:Purine permease n=1 Tax=Kuraishia capsulata CBS 1993 TaxID=1382522 RepID=W6MT23_9ASCO|nr:uncharacterized protein KUCA_T00005486001 [Kuraishia capsulata CBS 1993]CDK29498.1 unnamed protein product [Kuraishia capsulata CBS 1993]